MRILYLDCGMGAAGDMLMSALLELVPDKDKFVEKINNIGISNVKVKLESSVKCGIDVYKRQRYSSSIIACFGIVFNSLWN